MENMLFINVICSVVLAIISTISRYQFREGNYDTRDEWLEARRTCMRRRIFLFAFVALVFSSN